MFGKKLKTYMLRNKSVLIFFTGLIVVLSLLNIEFNNFLENVSIILAIPSFLISFFVLNNLSVTKYDLEDFYKKRKLKDDFNNELKTEFINYNNENLNVIKNLIEEYKKYLNQVKASKECNTQLINKCKKYTELVGFYQNTIAIVKSEFLDKIESNSYIDELDSQNYKDIYINESEVEDLKNKLEKLNDEYFTNSPLGNSKKTDLEFLFDPVSGIFIKYYKINRVTYIQLGGTLDEEI